jgi:ketosteroid isomerase-like protein
MFAESDTEATVATVKRFNSAFNQQDIEATMATMTEDCVFENTTPPPAGARYEGQAAVRATFTAFFQASPRAEFQVEELFAAGDRCVVRWTYSWRNEGGDSGYVRGVDIFRVRNGQIAEKLAYVKG